MDKVVNRKNIAVLKETEVINLKNKAESQNKSVQQMHLDRILHGQPQGLNIRVYAPIIDIKKKLVT